MAASAERLTLWDHTPRPMQEELQVLYLFSSEIYRKVTFPIIIPFLFRRERPLT